MSVISWVLDKCFALLMWTLLDPVGREVFKWSIATFILLFSYLTWKLWKETDT
jgi:hypothetical protein